MICRKCGKSNLHRRSRKGFWQNRILPLFGYYPWECMDCERIRFYRARADR